MAMLAPNAMLLDADKKLDYTTRLVYTEELKSYPFNAVWDYYCEKAGVPTGLGWFDMVKKYEADVLFKR